VSSKRQSLVVSVPGEGMIDLLNPESWEAPWHHSPAFGSSTKTPFTEIQAGQLKPIFGATEWPGPPEIRTLSCAVTYNLNDWPGGSTPLNRCFQLTGVLQFGTGAAEQTAEFDFENGVQLCVPATSLKVGVRLEVSGSDAVPLQLNASVIVANGCPPRQRAPRRSFLLATQGFDGTDIDIRIPAFARSYNWTAITGAASPGLAFQQWSGPPGGGGGGYLLTQQTAAQIADSYLRGQATPLPSQTRVMRLTGPAGVFAGGNLSFNLDL